MSEPVTEGQGPSAAPEDEGERARQRHEAQAAGEAPAAQDRPAADRRRVRPAGARSDRRAVAVMTIAHGIQHFYVAGLAITYPFVVAEFHASYAVLGLWLSAAGVLGGLLQAAAGLLRRASARTVLAVQDLAMGGASVLGAVAGAFPVFGLARVLGSAVSWPQHPVGSAYLAERFPKRRATVLSWHTAGGSLGTAAVPLLMSAVLAAAGWRWALVALGAALAAGGLLIRLALPPERGAAGDAPGRGTAGPDLGMAVPERRTAGPAVARAAPAGASGRAWSWRPARRRGAPEGPARAGGLWRQLRRREVAAVLAAGTIAAGGRGLGTLSTYIPAYLRSGLRLPTLTVGVLVTIVLAASIAGPVFGGVLADRFGRARTLIVTYVAAAGVLAAFGYAGRGVVVLALLGVAVGVLGYAESPLLQAVFSDLLGGAARGAFGVFFAISYGVGSLWTAVIGWVITAAGFATAFAVMAGSFVAAALIIALAIPRRRRGAAHGA